MSENQVYKRAQVHELEWWTDNQIDMSLEWGHYMEHLGEWLSEIGHVGVAIDVGSGPIPFLCSGNIEFDRGIAVDPLIHKYADIEWVKEQIACEFERVADIHDLLTGTSDLTLCLNTIDHVESPYEMVRQLARVTAMGGFLVVAVDLDKPPDVYHPHTIKGPTLIRALSRYAVTKLCVIDDSWKFENKVLWYVGGVK